MITAKEFIQNYIEENNHDSNIDVEDALIEFAKMHVETALKQAVENAKTKEDVAIFMEGTYVTQIVDKDSIRNAYPLTNIK